MRTSSTRFLPTKDPVGLRQQRKPGVVGPRTRRLLAGLALLQVAPNGEAGQKFNDQRSYYVPVRFVTCPHVENTTISVVGEDMIFGPGVRTFLFTYDTDRKEIIPKFVEVRIKGDGLCNGKPFETNVLVTVAGILSANAFNRTDSDAIQRKLGVRRDIRLSEQRVFIACSNQCERCPGVGQPENPPDSPQAAPAPVFEKSPRPDAEPEDDQQASENSKPIENSPSQSKNPG